MLLFKIVLLNIKVPVSLRHSLGRVFTPLGSSRVFGFLESNWRKRMSRELFVGNLPYSATEESLNQYFSGSGKVESVKIITDAHTGRSRGFGFVKMESDEGATKAIQDLDGKEYEGRALKVNEAGGGNGSRRPPRGNRPEGGSFRPRESGGMRNTDRRPYRS
jgi:RNA recognition motif-containing protein